MVIILRPKRHIGYFQPLTALDPLLMIAANIRLDQLGRSRPQTVSSPTGDLK